MARYWAVFVLNTHAHPTFSTPNCAAADIEFRTAAGTNVAPGATAIQCMGGAGEAAAARAVDGDVSTRWRAVFPGNFEMYSNRPPWVGIDLGEGNDAEITAVAWRASAGVEFNALEYPKEIAIAQSADGINWQTRRRHAAIPAWISGETRVFDATQEPIANEAAPYWRIRPTSTSVGDTTIGGWFGIQQLKFRDDVTGIHLTYRGNRISQGAVTTYGMVSDTAQNTFSRSGSNQLGGSPGYGWLLNLPKVGYNFGLDYVYPRLVQIAARANAGEAMEQSPTAFRVEQSFDGVTYVEVAAFVTSADWGASEERSFLLPAPTYPAPAVVGAKRSLIGLAFASAPGLT
jgi:hypothetical protein